MEELCEGLKRAKRILVLTGAGISVNAGIPDFRSPENGIYAKHNIDPEDVFHIESFRHDPVPLYRMMCGLVCTDSGDMRTFQPTKTHRFLKSLQLSGKLLRVYTQNIDGLDCEGIQLEPEREVVQCHGHLRSIACSDCSRSSAISFTNWLHDVFAFLAFVDKGGPSMIPGNLKCNGCSGFLKPAVVLFGESANFPSSIISDVKNCDLLLVIGTSLTVFPFAAVPSMIPCGVPKFVVTKGPVAAGLDAKIISEDCDFIFSEICKQLGFHYWFGGEGL